MDIKCQSSLTLTSNHIHSVLEDMNSPSSHTILHLRCLGKPMPYVNCRPVENEDGQNSKCLKTGPRNFPSDTHTWTIPTSSILLGIFLLIIHCERGSRNSLIRMMILKSQCLDLWVQDLLSRNKDCGLQEKYTGIKKKPKEKNRVWSKKKKKIARVWLLEGTWVCKLCVCGGNLQNDRLHSYLAHLVYFHTSLAKTTSLSIFSLDNQLQ